MTLRFLSVYVERDPHQSAEVALLKSDRVLDADFQVGRSCRELFLGSACWGGGGRI